MKITEVTRIEGYSVEAEDKYYSRYSPTCWYVVMGESDEPLYDCSKIEKLFQEFMVANDETW